MAGVMDHLVQTRWGKFEYDREVDMKNATTPHASTETDYPLYLHKVPGRDRVKHANPWDSLEQASLRPKPSVPRETNVSGTHRWIWSGTIFM